MTPAAADGVKVLWVTGTLSPRTKKELERAGWKVQAKVENKLVVAVQ